MDPHEIARSHSGVNKIVSAPARGRERSRRFPFAFGVLVQELNGDDLTGGVCYERETVKVSLEGAVVSYIVQGIFRETGSCQRNPRGNGVGQVQRRDRLFGI